jgi:hypothetical protein
MPTLIIGDEIVPLVITPSFVLVVTAMSNDCRISQAMPGSLRYRP